MFPKSPKLFNENVEFSHDVSQRNITAANSPIPKRPIDVSSILVGKIAM